VALALELAALVEASAGADDEGGTDLRLIGFDLSDVEREVLDLLLQGYRVNQIAVRTGASVATVRKRLRRVLTKTGTGSQSELVDRCRHEKVATPGPQPSPPSGSARRSRSPRT
jgi:DNA-binding CsgD family transcriptional regulator